MVRPDDVPHTPRAYGAVVVGSPPRSVVAGWLQELSWLAACSRADAVKAVEQRRQPVPSQRTGGWPDLTTPGRTGRRAPKRSRTCPSVAHREDDAPDDSEKGV